MAQSSEDEGFSEVHESRTFQFTESLFFGPSSHNTPPVFEVSGFSLLAKVAGSR